MVGDEPDEGLRLGRAGDLLRRRWRLLAALTIVGALLGTGAAFVVPPQYGSTSRMLLREAGATDDVSSEEAQIAGSLIVLDRAASALGRADGGAGLRGAVTASPDGNILEISATAGSPAEARDIATAVTEQYIGFSGDIAADTAGNTTIVLGRLRDSLQARLVEIDVRLGQLRNRSADPLAGQDTGELEQLNTERVQAAQAVDALNGAMEDAAAIGTVAISLIEPAVESPSPLAPRPLDLIGGGAALLLLVGCVGVLAANRRDDRLRREEAIAGALGAPVLCSVPPQLDAAAVAAERRQVRSRRGGRLRWWFREDRRWDEPAEPVARRRMAADRRYGLLLSRLVRSGAEPRHVLLVVPAGDVQAADAAARMAVVAATGGTAVAVLTDGNALVDVVAELTAGSDVEVLVTVSPTADGAPAAADLVLHIVEVAPAQPVIVGCGPVFATVVVLTSGTRTGWEIVAIAEACRQAGHAVTGAVVTGSAMSRDHEPGPAVALTAGPHRNGAAQAGAGGR